MGTAPKYANAKARVAAASLARSGAPPQNRLACAREGELRPQLLGEEPGENGEEATLAFAREIEDELRGIAGVGTVGDRTAPLGQIADELVKDALVEREEKGLVGQGVEEGHLGAFLLGVLGAVLAREPLP